MEKHRETQKELQMVFIDLEKACCSVPRRILEVFEGAGCA